MSRIPALFAYNREAFVCFGRTTRRVMARGNNAGSQTTKATLGLRELVVSGTIASGERLPEVELGRYVKLNDAFHDGLVELARSPNLARTLANVKALPFAMPSGAILASHAVLPRSQEILVIAQHQHWQLIESIRARQGTRAEEIAREHARLSRLNLELVLENREARDRMPGAPLLTEVA